ncbi:MAG TPA: DUF3048 domain-containing protein [Bacillaceae bacterium]|nr:DUF3048 domain-containing protein [Bacillaceae bacterium]
MKKKIPLMFILLLLFVLAACNASEEGEKDNGSNQNPVPEKKDNEDEELVETDPYQFPLTGIGMQDESTQRAVSAMISNQPPARPQTGLSKADVVYEILAEGSITRFLAIFQSELPENIGPIRSARDYFIDISQGYDSVYIAHGYSPEAKKMLNSGKYDHLNGIRYDGSLFKRASFRNAPHNSYITFQNIEKGANDEGFSLSGAPKSMAFLSEDDVANLTGENGAELTIKYSSNNNQLNAEYKFNAQTGKYERYSGGVKTAELDSNIPVLIDNIIVVETTHRIIDSKGRRDIDLSSGGKALLFQKGKVKEVEWKNESGRLVPYEGGQPAKLVPGKTWFNVVPDMNIVSYQ